MIPNLSQRERERERECTRASEYKLSTGFTDRVEHFSNKMQRRFNSLFVQIVLMCAVLLKSQVSVQFNKDEFQTDITYE